MSNRWIIDYYSILTKNSLLFFVLFGEEERKKKFPPKNSLRLFVTKRYPIKEEEGKREQTICYQKEKKKGGRKKEPGKKSGKGKVILFPSKRLISTRLWRGCEKFRIAPSSFHELSLILCRRRDARRPPHPFSISKNPKPPPPSTNSTHVLVEGRVRFPRRHQPAIRIRPTSWFKESRGQEDFSMMTWLLPTGVSRGLRQHRITNIHEDRR